MSEERLTDRVDNLERHIEEVKDLLSKGKKKDFGLKMKGVLGRQKLRMGYVIVQILNENGAVVFKKEPIVDSTIKIDDTFHVVEKENILIYKNKPFVILNKNRLHAFNPSDKVINETMGQKYILARMQNEAIKPKKGIGAMGGWILLILIGLGVAYYFLKSKGAA